MSSLDKVRVYVYSLKEIPTLDYVDMESIRHPYVQKLARGLLRV